MSVRELADHRCEDEPRCKCPNVFRVDVQGVNETRWATNALRFTTEDAAEAYARDLWSRWMGCSGWRIVTADTPDREDINPEDVRS